MFLKHVPSEGLIEVLDLQVLFDPLQDSVRGRLQRGEDPQDPEEFSKSELVFPSGEALPQCWVDAEYRTGS